MEISLETLRITQIMLSAGFGGAERLFVDVCLSLCERGHTVQAVCHPRFEALEQLTHENLQVDYLEAHWDWSPLARFRLRRLLASYRPQVIHIHLARGAAIGGAAAKGLNIPAAANLHNYVNLKYYRQINHFFPGTVDQQVYLERKGISKSRISVVPHFSRIPIVEEPEDVNSADSLPVFIAFGRFVKKKGFHILLESMKILSEQGLKSRLLLGGDGPEKQNLERQIAAEGLNEMVSLTGWVHDVANFLKEGPFFVLPSLDEPFGIVVLEAMACGKIIISTASQGPREILSDDTAYLVPIDDAPALAAALRAATLDRRKAHEKAVKALDRYRKNYAPGKVLPLYENIFRQMRYSYL